MQPLFVCVDGEFCWSDDSVERTVYRLHEARWWELGDLTQAYEAAAAALVTVAPGDRRRERLVSFFNREVGQARSELERFASEQPLAGAVEALSAVRQLPE